MYEYISRHQIQHYTQQLAKDTSANLKELTGLSLPASSSEQVSGLQ
jgi:hypothetical protein